MNKKEKEHMKMLVDLHQDAIVVMQAALIEWQHGKGAEAALQWLVNTLVGPGLLPDEDEPYGKDAQLYFNEHRANPWPRCECGNPSHIIFNGKGYCCDAHYQKAKAASLN